MRIVTATSGGWQEVPHLLVDRCVGMSRSHDVRASTCLALYVAGAVAGCDRVGVGVHLARRAIRVTVTVDDARNQLGDRFAYAVEGSIFVAGAAVQGYRAAGSPKSAERTDEWVAVGKAVLGHKKGDVVEVAAPSGSIKLQIMSIKAA